jgi:membrane protease subunit HflK
VLANNRKVIGGDGKQLIYVPMAQNAPGSPPVLPPDVLAPTVTSTPNTIDPRDERMPRDARDAAGSTR